MSALKFQVLTRLASEKRAGSACIVLDLGKCSSSDKIQQFQKDITLAIQKSALGHLKC